MLLIMKKLTLFLTALFLVQTLAAQDAIQLGDVVGSANVTTRSVNITGSPATLVASAARLFDLHGGFERSTERADFTAFGMV